MAEAVVDKTNEARLPARVAWALSELRKAGPRGISSIQYPGVRLSDCIYKLRQHGYAIETIRERHGGQFEGVHGRYCLHEGSAGGGQ